MILDSLHNIGRYRGLHRNLDLAIDFILKQDLNALPLGKTQVQGEDVFVLVQHPELTDNRKWEKHRQYMDIQIALEDGESIGWADDALPGFDDYDESRGDIQFSHEPAEGLACPIAKNCFGLYFAGEPHRPGMGAGNTRKAVVKVKLC